MLYITATPIGNRQDITERAKEVLASVDFVVAEDTRHTGELLAHYLIKKDLISFRDAPQAVMDKAISQILTRLQSGQSVAYVTDAGTPGISDPAWRLVSAVLDAGIAVSPIPGPSAVTALLSIANIQIDEYRFMGFLPKKKGFQTTVSDLIEYLNAGDRRAVIFYESPHRIQNTLTAFLSVVSGAYNVILTGNPKGAPLEGSRPSGRSLYAIIGRELTKKFESIYRGNLLDDFIKSLPDRGEYVVLLTTAV